MGGYGGLFVSPGVVAVGVEVSADEWLGVSCASLSDGVDDFDAIAWREVDGPASCGDGTSLRDEGDLNCESSYENAMGDVGGSGWQDHCHSSLPVPEEGFARGGEDGTKWEQLDPLVNCVRGPMRFLEEADSLLGKVAGDLLQTIAGSFSNRVPVSHGPILHCSVVFISINAGYSQEKILHAILQ